MMESLAGGEKSKPVSTEAVRAKAKENQRAVLLKVCAAKNVKPPALARLPIDLVAGYVRDVIGQDKRVDVASLRQAVADLAAERTA